MIVAGYVLLLVKELNFIFATTRTHLQSSMTPQGCMVGKPTAVARDDKA